MSRDWLKLGEYNALCDVCGLKRKSGQLIERWDGFMVCKPTIKPGCWEMRHPQDLIRPIPEGPKIPWSRPDPGSVNGSGVINTGQVDLTPDDPDDGVTIPTPSGYTAPDDVDGSSSYIPPEADATSPDIGIEFCRITDPGDYIEDGPSGNSTPATYVVGGVLKFTVQPSNVSADIAMSPAVKVSLVDAVGDVLTAFVGSITVAFYNNPSSATLGGTLTATAVAGVATFL